MQIRSMQAVSVAERAHSKPVRFSSLKSKQESIPTQDVAIQPLTNVVINKDLMQANSAAQIKSPMLDHGDNQGNRRNIQIVSGTSQAVNRINGQPSSSIDSRHNSTQNLSLKRGLQQRINTVEGFIIGVNDQVHGLQSNNGSSNSKIGEPAQSGPYVVGQHIPTVTLRQVVSKSGMASEHRNTSNNNTQRVDEPQYPMRSDTDLMIDSHQPDNVQNLQQIKILATAKKQGKDANNYDMNTPEGGVHLLDTAMKPVRLASGFSEENSPTGQQQVLKPKGIQKEMTVIEGQPELTVITSHFQPKIINQALASHSSHRERQDGDELRDGESPQPHVIVYEKAEPVRLRSLNQDDVALSTRRGNLSSQNQNQQLQGNSPELSQHAGASSLKNSIKPMKSSIQSIHSRSKQSMSPGRNLNTKRQRANTNDLSHSESLSGQLQITKIHPQAQLSRDSSRQKASLVNTGQQRITSRPVSDYKHTLTADVKKSARSQIPYIQNDERPLLKLKTQNNMIYDNSNENSLVKVGVLQSPGLSNRRIISNDGKSSSNSHRLNQDIMSAKIESSQDSHNVKYPQTQNCSGQHDVPSRLDSKRTSTILVHKLQNQDIGTDFNSTLLKDQKHGGQKTVFATMDRYPDISITSQHANPDPDAVTTPKRKSVLARKSQGSVNLSRQNKDYQVNQSHVMTLQGTISSQEAVSPRKVGQDVQETTTLMSENKSPMQHNQNTEPDVQNDKLAIEKPVRGQNVSAMTLKRESSLETDKSNSQILLSRVGSVEQHDKHAETMRDNMDQSSKDPYINHQLTTDEQMLKKKVFSAEISNGKNSKVISSPSHFPGKGKPNSNEMLLQLDENERDNSNSLKRINDKRSSQGFMATSLGEESFIHPPSPIHQNDMMSRPLYEMQSPMKEGDVRSGSDSSRSKTKFGQVGKGKQGVVQNVQMFQQQPYQQKIEGVNAIVVDVMHAGIDAQDFNDLSENDEQATSQDLIMIDRDSDLIIGQIGGAEPTELKDQNQGQKKRANKGISKIGSPCHKQPAADQLKLLRTGQAMPTISCLCKELDLTPEQFAQVVQQYKRQPRVIVKSETQQNQILLVGKDGTSKDSHLMDDIIQGTIKVDGLSIPRLVNKNMDYFMTLKNNEKSPHRQRQQIYKFNESRKDSDALFTSSRHTIDNLNMNQQLAQFIQFGKEFEVYNGNSTEKAKFLKSKIQSTLEHKNCRDGQHIIGEIDGYNTPLLLSSQFLEPTSKLDSSTNLQQMLGTHQLESSNKEDYMQLSLSPKTAYATKQLQDSYRGTTGLGPVPQKSSDLDANTSRQYYDNQTLKPKGTELLSKSITALSDNAPEVAYNPTEREEHHTKPNSVKRNDIDSVGSAQPSLAGIIPTKVEIFRPVQKRMTSEAVQNINVDNKQTVQDMQQNGDQYHNHQGGIKHLAKILSNKQQVIKMEEFNSPNNQIKEQYYLDSHLARSSDLTNQAQYSSSNNRFLGYIVESQKKKRVITPSLGRRFKETNYADTRNLQPAAKHFSAVSNTNKRSTLGQEFDVSTQWRHSNDQSRIDPGDSNESVIDQELETVKEQRRGRSTLHTNQVQSRAQSMQRAKRTFKKPSQIGALTAACRLTPNKIEFKIKPGQVRNEEKENKERDLLAKELSVIQSKRGMISEISRTFSSAMSHKTNIMRGKIRSTKVMTRTGVKMIQRCFEEGGVKVQDPKFLFSKGRVSVNSQEAAKPERNAVHIENNDTLNAEQTISRVHSMTQQSLYPSKRAPSGDFSSGNLSNINLNKDLHQAAQQQTPGQQSIRPWAGFNETRRMTANHVNKRDKLIDNQGSKAQMKQMGETTSQMYLASTNAENQLSNMWLPVGERIGTAATTNLLVDGGKMNQTNNFKRSTGDPIVRITKSSENPERTRLAQKSASLLRGNTKNKLGISHKRKNSKKGKATSVLSIEQMIKELGKQDSMVNTQLVGKVNARANFRAGVLNDAASSSVLQQTQDYYLPSDADLRNTAKDFKLQTNKTVSNFFSAAQLQRLDKSTVGGTETAIQKSQYNDDTTADCYSSHVMRNQKTQNWLSKVKGVDPLTTQISWNRARGSLLPSKNQSKGDMIPMDPISSLISSERADNYSTNTIRAQVQSQNIQKRRLFSKKATEIYYAMRQVPAGSNYDLVAQKSKEFSQLEQPAHTMFKTRHGSVETPLEKFYQTNNGF